jgi:S1-C subfamily serine protease
VRFVLLILSVLAFGSGKAGAALAEWAPSAMNNHIDQTNFVVNAGCSGTLIDLGERYILTANHCVLKQYAVVEREVIDKDGVVTTEKVRVLRPGTVKQIAFDGPLAVREVTYRTEVIAVDKDRDLAVLRVLADLPNTTAAKLACTDPVRGEQVYIVGNPTGDLYSSVVSGMVSSIQRTYGTIKFGSAETQPLMQISGGVVGGNSGGAVYDANGELIGVPVLAHNTAETLAFAVPLYVIKEFLVEKSLADVFGYCEPGA